MSKQKNLLRVGDSVKIVNPLIVIRWGYPLTKQIAKDTLISREQKDAIYAMIMSFRKVPVLSATSRDNDGITLGEFILDSVNRDKDITYKKILDLMAYEVLCREHFGGRERQLFTQNRESLRSKLGRITERKVVKTGRYCAPRDTSGWTDCGYEYDFDPGGLADEKTHVLFRVHVDTYQEGVCPNINYESYNTGPNNIFYADGVWFEKKDLIKYTDEMAIEDASSIFNVPVV